MHLHIPAIFLQDIAACSRLSGPGIHLAASLTTGREPNASRPMRVVEASIIELSAVCCRSPGGIEPLIIEEVSGKEHEDSGRAQPCNPALYRIGGRIIS